MKNDIKGLIVFWITILFCCMIVVPAQVLAETEAKEAKYRQPIDLLLDATNEHLLVACSGTGEIEVYDTQTNQKIACIKLDASLDSLASLGGKWIASCSTKSNQTHIFMWSGKTLQRVAKIPNSHSPVKLYWEPQTQSLFVACLWSRRIDVIHLADELKTWRFDGQ